MHFLGNLVWILAGGWFMALVWLAAGILAYISILGIPWGRACLVIARFTLFPFGYEAVPRNVAYGKGDIGTGIPGMLGNIIWFILPGLWIALGHLVIALLLALTIIGIPFAWQHLKLAELALHPIGKTILPAEVAHEAWRRHAAEQHEKMREKA